MKNIIIILLLALSLFSCTDTTVTYRVRVIKTKKIVLIEQGEIKGQLAGDTVQLSYNSSINSYIIDKDFIRFRDTSYLDSYPTSDTTEHSYFVSYASAVIETIIK